jgi:hypothetical protein
MTGAVASHPMLSSLSAAGYSPCGSTCTAGFLEASKPSDVELAARAIVSDDGCEIRLTLYNENGAAFAAPIAPGRAVALAGELIAAALPKLPR